MKIILGAGHVDGETDAGAAGRTRPVVVTAGNGQWWRAAHTTKGSGITAAPEFYADGPGGGLNISTRVGNRKEIDFIN